MIPNGVGVGGNDLLTFLHYGMDRECTWMDHIAGGTLGSLIAKGEDEYEASGRNTRELKLGSSIMKCLTFTIRRSRVYG